MGDALTHIEEGTYFGSQKQLVEVPKPVLNNPEIKIQQVIEAIRIKDNGPCTNDEFYQVGVGDVTKIEQVTYSGMHSDIPYLRVWTGDKVYAEFCRHNIIGVYYSPEALSQ